MRHIRQKNDIDCGIAVVAMLAGVSYRDALAVDPDPECERGLSVGELRGMLVALTDRPWVEWKPRPYAPLSRSQVEQGAVLIRRRGDRFGHWIASDGRLCYDPERNGPLELARYDRAWWTLVRTVRLSRR